MISDKKLTESPMLGAVAAVSVGIVDKKPLLDLCYVEDNAAEVDMNLVMNAAGQFIELQGTGEQATYTEGQLAQLLALGKKGIGELIVAQQKALSVAWQPTSGGSNSSG
jgi:ribonuclease PH